MLPTEPHVPRAKSQLIRGDMSRALAEIALGLSQAVPAVAAPEIVVGHEADYDSGRITITIRIWIGGGA